MEVSTTQLFSRKSNTVVAFLKQSIIFLCVLIALQGASPALVFAASVPFQLGQNEALDRAGVSVVRLLVSYTEAGAARPDVQCTGLGVLVASWPSTDGYSPAPNNFLLADGNLLNPNNGATCLPPNETKKLIPTVQIFYSDAYTAKGLTGTSVPSNPIPITPDSVHCQDATCKDSLALLGFHTDPAYTQPYIDLATGSQPQSDGLALTNASGQLAFSPVNTTPQVADFYKAGIGQSLTPNLVSPGQVNESWLPLVNSHGQLVGVQWSNATGNPTMTSTDIQNFLNGVPELKAPPANPLHDSWNSGIASYYNGHYSDAEKDFQTAFQLNQTFLGAQKMEQLAANPKPLASNSATKNNPSESTGNLLGDLLTFWPWLVVAAVIVVLLVSVAIRIRSILIKRAWEKELKEVEQQAAIETESIGLQEEQRRLELAKQSTIPPQARIIAPTAPERASHELQTNLYCPRCNAPVTRDTKYCPNCRLQLPVSQAPVSPQIPNIVPVAPEPPQIPAKKSVDAFDKSSILDVFLEEMNGYLPDIETNLKRLAQSPSDKRAAEVAHRRTHTIKGAAAMMDFPGLAQVARGMEDILSAVLDSSMTLDDPTLGLLNRSLGRLRQILEGIGNGISTEAVVTENDEDYARYHTKMNAPTKSVPPRDFAPVAAPHLPEGDKPPVVLIADDEPPKDEQLLATPDPTEPPPNAEEVAAPVYQVKPSSGGPRAGDRLGNYRLVRLIGHGGFADVYLAEHRFLKTQAAIKVLHTRLTKEAMMNFINEARTIATLVHPHIVRVLEFGMEGDEPDLEQSFIHSEGCIPFLIMDYAPGKTLRHRHPKGTRLPLATVVAYVKDVAEALQYAHDKKLIHRDVKPENMLIGHHNEVLLSDFGIAAVAHNESSMVEQKLAGTIPYIAPEQLRNRPQPASDQYSLGIVTYEWLCGERPFQGNEMTVVVQHLTEEPPPLREKLPSLSPMVEEVVTKALEKDPARRFASVTAFARALEQAAK